MKTGPLDYKWFRDTLCEECNYFSEGNRYIGCDLQCRKRIVHLANRLEKKIKKVLDKK